jgi:hypothetical protein
LFVTTLLYASLSATLFDRVADAFPTALRVINNDGMLPLHWAAAKSRSLPIIQRLLTAHPEAVSQANAEGYLPLHCAGQNDDLNIVRTIYQAFPEAISIRDHEGGLPLHHACCFTENVQVVRFLYEAYKDGITVAQDHGGIAPIHLAASQNDSPEIIRFILSVCPQTAALRDDDGWCAAHCLLGQKNWSPQRLECLRIVLRANATLSDLYQPSLNDVVARMILRHERRQDLARFLELNWKARRPIMLLFVYLAKSMTTFQDGDQTYHRSYRTLQMFTARDRQQLGVDMEGMGSRWDPLVIDRLVQYDINRMKVLQRLVLQFMGPDIAQVPPGVLRKIVLFV